MTGSNVLAHPEPTRQWRRRARHGGCSHPALGLRARVELDSGRGVEVDDHIANVPLDAPVLPTQHPTHVPLPCALHGLVLPVDLGMLRCVPPGCLEAVQDALYFRVGVGAFSPFVDLPTAATIDCRRYECFVTCERRRQ